MALPEVKLPEGFHENSVVRQVPLNLLHVDRSYQRDPSQALVDKIAEEWDEVASELALVSDRGERDPEGNVKGGLWLVNGQHRTLAARKIGLDAIWARVIDLSAVEDPGAVEAGLRLKTNVRLGDRPLECFKAQLRNGDEDSLKIVEILAGFDTQINEIPDSEHGINAVATVEQIYRADLLYDTMALLKDAFDTLGGRAVSASMMRAAAWFIEKHAFECDRYRVWEKMKLTGTAALYRRATTIQASLGGSLWVNYYRTLVDLYNEKLSDKNKLEFRLRGSGKLSANHRIGRGTLRW